MPTDDAAITEEEPEVATVEEIVCMLDDTVVTGEWIASIMTQFGSIPNAIETVITIPASVSSIEPSSDVNYLGGDIMTITGDNFGYDPSGITVTYDDGTICDVLTADMTTITCENRRFTRGASSMQAATVNINGVEDSSLTFTLLE